MTTHTATLLAWCRSDSPYQMQQLASTNPVEAISATTIYLPHDADQRRMDGWAQQGYILVGTADVTLHLRAPETLAAAQIDTLRAQKKAVMAEAQNKATQIERQIQTLLAIAA